MRIPEQPASSDAQALAGWTVVITRPRDSSAPLVQGLRRHGAQVLHLPAQEIEPNPHFDWTAAMATFSQIDEWIFTSPSATRHAQSLLDRGLPNSHVFAVGSATARTLARHGVDAVAPDRHHNSEALLEQRGLIDVEGRHIAIVTAPGGRGLIATTLRERGAKVVEWPVYRRRTVRWSQRQLDALTSASDPLLTIISSAEALGTIATALSPALWQRLRDGRWLASSSRLEALLRQHGANRIDLAASALVSDLLKATLSLR